MRIGRVISLLALALAFGSSGCATKTSTTHLWHAEDYAARPIKTAIVFARNMAEAQRRSVEQQLADALGDHGVAATPSYQLFPEPPAEEQAKAEVTKRGFEGVLVVSLRGVRERRSYMPGHYMGGGWGGGYYGMGWGWSPGYIVTDEIVDAETSLWDLRAGSDRLVWSAVTKTTNPTSGEDLTRSMSREILPGIARTGIIEKTK
jgi:hypothetical protein